MISGRKGSLGVSRVNGVVPRGSIRRQDAVWCCRFRFMPSANSEAGSEVWAAVGGFASRY